VCGAARTLTLPQGMRNAYHDAHLLDVVMTTASAGVAA
jgi:hypothetical protein